MKKFLMFFSLIVALALPNFTQADALEDFKNVIASKHFVIKYTIKTDDTNDEKKRNFGYLMKVKRNWQIADSDSYYDNYISANNGKFIEGINGEDFILEKITHIPGNYYSHVACYYKIEDKLFIRNRIFRKGKYRDAKSPFTSYYEIGNKKIYGNINIKIVMDSLLDEENYFLVGSGTNDEGLIHFDVKLKTSDGDSLKAIRYYFDNSNIKRITIATYNRDLETGEMKGSRSIIEVEEFNSNPNDSDFKLPDKFRKFESMGKWTYGEYIYGGDLNSIFEGEK